MIRPTVQIKDSGSKEFENLIKRLNKGRQAYVTIGVHNDGRKYSEGNPPPEVAEVALWNEFGTKLIPERSFIRSTFNESESKRNQWYSEMVNNITQQKWDVKKALEAIGFRFSELIRNKIKSNVPPPYGSGKKPNSSDVIEKRQAAKNKKWPGMGNKTLQASRTLLDSIGFKVHT